MCFAFQNIKGIYGLFLHVVLQLNTYLRAPNPSLFKYDNLQLSF